MKDTKERILSEGIGLLARHGLAGVSLGVLAERTGLSKSGLFAHFGSKEEVQLGLLAETARVAAASFVDNAMTAPVGLRRLEALFLGWLGWGEKAGLKGGCPIAAGMFELDDADINDPVRQHLLHMEQEWRDFLMRLTIESVESGELRSDLEPEQFVWELCGFYLAHHTSQRFIRDPFATERAMRAFNSLVTRCSTQKETRTKTARRRVN